MTLDPTAPYRKDIAKLYDLVLTTLATCLAKVYEDQAFYEVTGRIVNILQIRLDSTQGTELQIFIKYI